MQIYQPTLKGPMKVSGYIDPNDTTNIGVFWGAPQWLPNTVYRIGYVVSPSIDNGYYYQCTTNGITGPTEPTWQQDDTDSGTAIFSPVPWDLWLIPNQTITSSSWSSDQIVNLSNNYITATTTGTMIGPFSNTIAQFEITNIVTKNTGESLSRSFLYKTNQQ